MSFWSGAVRNAASESVLMNLLAKGCRFLCDYAVWRGVRLAFEPEPGMFIESFTQFEELLQQVDASVFVLTIDIGHVHCVE